MNVEEIRAFNDLDLATYQAGFRPETRQYVLCQIEWQRRLQIENFHLAEKISSRERVATLLGAVFGVVATLLGVLVAR